MARVDYSAKESSVPSQWLSRLSGPWGFRAVILVAALLALPSLFVGFFLDDYAHLEAVDGISPVASPWNLYCFAPGDPEAMRRIIDTGPYPWFTQMDIHVRFFRPLSSATMVLDRRLFGDASWGYHLHSVLWYLALLIVLKHLLQRALPGSLAPLTLALFAVSQSHWFPIVWWAHRNTLVAATLGFAGLLAYVRCREDGWKPGLPLSLLGFGLGLLGGEVAFSVFGYVIAYEALARRGSITQRIRAVCPLGALAVLYLAGYLIGGFGVKGTGCYFSPFTEPLTYLRHAPERFLILAANQFFLVPAEIAGFKLEAVVPVACAGATALAIVGIALRAVWPRLDLQEQRGVRWLAVGSLLAAPPFLAPFASGRLLLVISLGGAAIIAAIIREGRRLAQPPLPVAQPPSAVTAIPPAKDRPSFPHRKKLVALAWTLIVLHLAIAPVTWLLLTPGFAVLNRHIQRVAHEIDLDDSRAADQQVTLLNAFNPAVALYGAAIRASMGRPRPAAWHPLMLAPFDETFTRTGPHEFQLTLNSGEMFKTLPELVARDPRHMLRPGDTLRFPSFDVEILDAGQVGPTRMAFRFRAPLEDPRYVWLAWQQGNLRRFIPPPVGKTINLPPAFLR